MWKEYARMTSPSQKGGVRSANATRVDDAYEREQRKIELMRQKQQQIAERRYKSNYGTPKEKANIQFDKKVILI